MRICVIGAGFSGLAAIKAVTKSVRHLSDCEIALFDKYPYTTMIPSLPDLAGGILDRSLLTGNIPSLVHPNVRFHHEAVTCIDLRHCTIKAATHVFPYDYLVIASGSVANLSGFGHQHEKIHVLDCLDNALKIQTDFINYLHRREPAELVIIGGGYTGLELAGTLKHLADSKGKKLRVSIVEQSDAILRFLEEDQRKYLQDYCASQKYAVFTSTEVIEFDGANVRLSNGSCVEDVFLCFTAGSKFAVSIIDATVERIPDGRLVVNKFLQLPQYENVFVVGDSAAIRHGGAYLRKAVNFAIFSGAEGGRNLVRLATGKPLRAFRPIDLGWIVPLQGTSVGMILGTIPVKGKIGLRLHYLMCGYRSVTMTNMMRYWRIAMRLY
jgi:NADH dehydrogenase